MAKLADGTIACSATNLWTCLQNVLKWNVPEEEAIRAATFNPAKAIGAADKVGTIETGKLADFVVTNADYSCKRVFIGGKRDLILYVYFRQAPPFSGKLPVLPDLFDKILI